MTSLPRSVVTDVSVLSLQEFHAINSSLVVFEDSKSETKFSRLFFIKSAPGEIRGNHAHFACNQWLLCLTGKIKVTLFDGIDYRYAYLSDDTHILFVPAGIWAVQEYLEQSTLCVLSDRNYEDHDYIRSLDLFTSLKRDS